MTLSRETLRVFYETEEEKQKDVDDSRLQPVDQLIYFPFECHHLGIFFSDCL